MEDILSLLGEMLGPEEFEPIAEDYRAKLHSVTEAKKKLVSQPARQTPRFILVTVSPQDKQERRLEAVPQDNVVALKSSMVKEYFGSAADIQTASTVGVL